MRVLDIAVEEQRVNVILSFIDPIDKWKNLGDAFRVEAAIIIDSVNDVITVPLSALFRHNEVWSVFKVVDGEATLQNVSVGRRNDRSAEIIKGLLVGEQVITHPGNGIDNGVKVVHRN